MALDVCDAWQKKVCLKKEEIMILILSIIKALKPFLVCENSVKLYKEMSQYYIRMTNNILRSCEVNFHVGNFLIDETVEANNNVIELID